MVMSPGQMLLTHFIIVCVYDAIVICHMMLLGQPILFFICWVMMLKNLEGTRVSPALMLLGYDNYFYCNTVYYLFNFNSGDLTNTSSHICGSWYLPIFLFRDGSLTLISMASLMVLVMLWSSLPTMLKLFRDTS